MSDKTKELVVISGKGGTGKTSVMASFAALVKNKVMADCDVDAADLHLLLKPDIKKRENFICGKEAVIRQEDCIACGACLARCRYDAIKRDGEGASEARFTVDKLSCEGCGVCVLSCPVEAIDFNPCVSGEWFISDTRCGPMVHARLGIAEENSGKLVSLVRQQAAQIAMERGLSLIITDGPPGIGCPVIASIGGATLVLLITEPSLSGLHDLERAAGLVQHFKRPVMACVNRADINPDITSRIHERCAEMEIPVIADIPYDKSFTRAQIEGRSVVENGKSPAADAVRAMCEKVYAALESAD